MFNIGICDVRVLITDIKKESLNQGLYKLNIGGNIQFTS